MSTLFVFGLYPSNYCWSQHIPHNWALFLINLIFCGWLTWFFGTAFMTTTCTLHLTGQIKPVISPYVPFVGNEISTDFYWHFIHIYIWVSTNRVCIVTALRTCMHGVFSVSELLLYYIYFVYNMAATYLHSQSCHIFIFISLILHVLLHVLVVIINYLLLNFVCEYFLFFIRSL